MRHSAGGHMASGARTPAGYSETPERTADSAQLRVVTQRLQGENRELRDLCCFLDSERHKARWLARQWSRFGRQAAVTMSGELSTCLQKLRDVEARQDALLQENTELKELCWMLDMERSPGLLPLSSGHIPTTGSGSFSATVLEAPPAKLAPQSSALTSPTKQAAHLSSTFSTGGSKLNETEVENGGKMEKSPKASEILSQRSTLSEIFRPRKLVSSLSEPGYLHSLATNANGKLQKQTETAINSAFDKQDNMRVQDTNNRRLQRFSSMTTSGTNSKRQQLSNGQYKGPL
uniref:coiled-coil domain-containing protein 85C-like isoform X2 n=1 Tax=Myxine glutinosa TaxID=7769 RepID=UPI00358FB021